MDQPPASSRLPKGWQNMPETILHNVTLRLPYADAAAHCDSFTRMEKICDNDFWAEKAELDFKNGNSFEIIYPIPYFNYLVARIHYLQLKINALLPDLIPAYYKFRAKQEEVIGFDRTSNLDIFIKTALRFDNNLLFEYILRHKFERREILEYHPLHYSTEERHEIIANYFKSKQSILDQIRSLQDEADLLSMKLAQYLDETNPHSFRFVKIPDDFEDIPDSFRMKVLNEEKKKEIINYFLSLGIKSKDLILYRDDLYFFSDPSGKNQYRLGRSKFDNMTTFEAFPLEKGPLLFKIFAQVHGLTINAVRWLYNLTTLTLVKLTEDYKLAQEGKLTKETPASIEWRYQELNSRLKQSTYPRRRFETVELEDPEKMVNSQPWYRNVASIDQLNQP